MSDRATIFGFGGHARVVRELLHGRYHQFIYVTTDGIPGTQSEDDWIDSVTEPGDVFLAIGDNAARQRIHRRLIDAGITPSPCIADSAIVAHDASIGAGTVVCSGAVVMTNAKVGQGVIINTLSSVDHDCVVEDFAQITPGVTLGGTTTIGEGAFLGIKSATIHGMHVGAGATVMAGAVVTRHVPPHAVVGGVPARIIRDAPC